MEQKCYGIRNIASFPAGMLPVLPSCHVTLTPCCIVPWQQSVATRLIQIACCYGANIRSDLRVTTRTRLTRGNFTRRLGYRRAKCPAVALWWIIHELNCSICSLIIFTVVTDQHSAAIIVQAVDDVGYSLLYAPVLFVKVTLYSVYVYGRGTLCFGGLSMFLHGRSRFPPRLKYWLPIHYDTIEDGQKKISSFILILY